MSLYNLRYIINAKAQIEADSEDAARAVLADIIDDCIDLLPGDYVDIVSCERDDPPTSTTPTPYTAVPRLPDTGAAHITALLSAGALSLFAGLLAVGLTPLRRAMNNHRKDLK